MCVNGFCAKLAKESAFFETRNATGHFIHNMRYFLVRNNPATNGMVHMVDRVLVPAVDTITEVLSADLHFKTMMAALEAAELSQLLAGPGHFTLFVPTDEAFDKLDEATRARILGSGGCSKDLIMSHILSEVSNLLVISRGVFLLCSCPRVTNEPDLRDFCIFFSILVRFLPVFLLLFHQKCALYDTGRPWLLQVVCSGVVDREVSVTNLAGHSMKLTRDEDGSVEVAGVKLFMRDKMTTNGVIHVIGEWDGYQSFKHRFVKISQAWRRPLLGPLPG